MDLRDSTFVQTVEQAAKYGKWQNEMSPQVKIQSKCKIQQTQLYKYCIPVEHQLMSSYEFQSIICYVFTCAKKNKKQFSITYKFFKKQNGSSTSYVIQDLKGIPSCLTLSLSLKKIQNNSDQYNLITIIGLKQGFIKSVQLIQSKKQNKTMRTQINNTKVEHKKIVSIVCPQKQFFNQKNICFVLLEDNKTLIFNFLSKVTVCIFQPPTLGHDLAVCLTLHRSQKYFATCTRSGQIIFWELNQAALKAIQISEQKLIKQSKSKQQVSAQFQWKFKATNRFISLFPMHMLHSASIFGLKWIGFIGNLLGMLSNRGLFKIIAINFEMKQQFINIIQYQVQKGQSISSVQFFPQKQTVYFCIPQTYTEIKSLKQIQKENQNDGQYIYDRQKNLKTNDRYFRSNYSTIKHKRNNECYIQKIKFNAQKSVHKIQRIKFSNNFQTMIVSEDQMFIACSYEKGFFISVAKNKDQLEQNTIDNG